MSIESQRLKTFILDAGLADQKQIEEAEQEAARSGKNLRDVLVDKKIVSEAEIIKLEAYILGIPFIDLEKVKVSPEVLQIIPEPIARKNNIVSYKQTGQNLEVAMVDPEDLQTIEFIKKKSNLKILPRLTTPESVRAVLTQYQKTLAAEFGEFIKTEAEAAPEIAAGEKDDLKKMAEDLPIIRIVDALLRHAALQNASDIHIEPLEKEVIVRYRIDGILHEAMILPKQVQSGITARVKILASLKIDEHRLPQDGRFKIEIEGRKISLRVSILPVFDGEKIVMRLLPEESHGLTLESLGLRSEALEIIHRNIRRPVGMFLVTGPTGSGKTTTLYTAIDILNMPEVNISTVEDPVEYRMERVNQTQVNPAIGLTFASGLRSLLRQDPDIIMVGEIRDEETASLAVNAALTGHLVLSTLHTNSAAGSLPRLIDMKVEPFLISSTINCILAQRLVRKLCGEREKYFLTADEIQQLGKEFDLEKLLAVLKKEKAVDQKADWPEIPFYKAKMSSDCSQGYKGRTGIYEVFEMSPKIKELIMKSATADEIEAAAKEEGMISMLEDGFIKAAQGITSLEEILRVARE